MFPILLLFAAGIFIATLGSMTGLGGGFLAVPFLALVWGMDRPEAVLISLTMILANSVSASVYYIRAKMVEWKLVLMLSVAGIPALYLGYEILRSMETAIFDLTFAVLLFTVTTYLLLSRTRYERKERKWKKEGGKGAMVRKKRLAPLISFPLGFLAGLVSSAFGIGGGAILMPLQVGVLRMNVKNAIATSMFLIMLLSGYRVVVISGGFDWFIAIPLALGAVLGAQFGARIVKRLKSGHLLRILAGFLFFIAAYMGVNALIDLL